MRPVHGRCSVFLEFLALSSPGAYIARIVCSHLGHADEGSDETKELTFTATVVVLCIEKTWQMLTVLIATILFPRLRMLVPCVSSLHIA